MSKQPPEIVITLRDGLVECVYTDTDVNVLIADFDIEGMDEERLIDISKTQPFVQMGDMRAYCEEALVYYAPLAVRAFNEAVEALPGDIAGTAHVEQAAPRVSTADLDMRDHTAHMHIAPDVTPAPAAAEIKLVLLAMLSMIVCDECGDGMGVVERDGTAAVCPKCRGQHAATISTIKERCAFAAIKQET